MVELLERLARAESPSLEPETQRGPFRILAAELERDGLLRASGQGQRAWATTCTHGPGTAAAAPRASC